MVNLLVQQGIMFLEGSRVYPVGEVANPHTGLPLEHGPQLEGTLQGVNDVCVCPCLVQKPAQPIGLKQRLPPLLGTLSLPYRGLPSE